MKGVNLPESDVYQRLLQSEIMRRITVPILVFFSYGESPNTA